MEQKDWDDLEAQMASPWGHMKLRCDQYEVSLAQEADTKSRKWATTVYVDGVLNGAWCIASRSGEAQHDEARRFMRRTSSAMFSAKEIERYRKVFGKREADKMAAKRFVYFRADWTSFNSLKKHLLANNTSIERIH
ncbi:hypothetical protein FBY21_1201 [Pseudomonas sp. SLBN-26]|uniref:hypothetical protein n=1 Tax=Pseudomonadaceae TaxID=135621 RepID=UPI00114FB20F|nr:MULTISPECIES: hypothetical protein [Pseudomonas]MCP1616594.1 tellurite resistance protein [Pseudomonas otitidis]MDH1105670.1 hypothetical protein [Pseudomonas otitidis]MDH1160101.1 hypothetical protein [Pseudomonas otitidis]MDH1164483.1 hypothetical protein [Pseudomonas otitidis]TQL05850.1 hypothetical protein FBY21_1201 [Pseudomonas sp. SLBN-26]